MPTNTKQLTCLKLVGESSIEHLAVSSYPMVMLFFNSHEINEACQGTKSIVASCSTLGSGSKDMHPISFSLKVPVAGRKTT